MNIDIKYCNNIDEGHVEIVDNKLNIKYAINGTGKSTISKAISIYLKDKINGSKELKKLKPFKFLNTDENDPEIRGIDHLTNIKVFDEDYVNKYVFLPDELVQGSFDIFIRDEEYENGLKEITELTSIIQNSFIENKDIDELINDFTELSNSFGKPVKNGIHASSSISKAFKGGNKVLNVPTEIEEYKDFIQSDNNYKWLKWIIDGKVYLDLTDNCPYCITDISKKKTKITKISELYEPKVIEYLNKIVAVFTRLDKYFSEDTRNTVHGFISNIEGYTNDQAHFLLEVKEQIDRLNNKFSNSKRLGFQSLKNVDKVIEALREQRIDANLFSHLKSDDTIQKVDIINKSIDTLLEKAGILQGKIAKQKAHIEEIIQENKSEINAFLKNAGFNYHVDLVEDSKKQYSLKLRHKDITDTLTDVKDHLSFGERNAFSIVLFMYDALKSHPDIIILDDPISSFDKNKKYAIIDMLFRRDKSFRNKTVLLLTHDFEPILDMVFHHRGKFDVPQASFLENNHGNLSEKMINKSNMKTFIDICRDNINSSVNDITKLVYLRRLYEIMNEKGDAYQLVSNLLHKRDTPLWLGNRLRDESTEEINRNMTPEEISSAVNEIKNDISNFDYTELLNKLKDDKYMKELYYESECNYEKLHIYRVLYDDKTDKIESSVISKFINQAFHLENDYIYQLNPCEYQLVPQYVIDECDSQLASI